MARDSSGRRAPAGPRPAGRLLDLRLRRLLLVGAVTAVTLAGTLGTQRSLEAAAAGRGAPATGRGAQWQGWGQWQAGRERIDALAVLLLLAGPPSAAQWATVSVALDRVTPGGTGAEAYNWLSTANATGFAIGGLLAGVAVEAGGTEAAFLAAAVSVALAAVLVAARRASLSP